VRRREKKEGKRSLCVCVNKSWYGREREQFSRNSQKIQYLNEKVILMPNPTG
jgi:hypothetical protein